MFNKIKIQKNITLFLIVFIFLGSGVCLAKEVSNTSELQSALDNAKPGQIIILNDGEYNGPFVLNRSGKKHKRIIIRAKNRHQAIILGSGSDRDAFSIEGEVEAKPASVQYITINGLKFQDAERAGLRISWADKIRILNCEFANNGTWGLFTDFSTYNRVINNDVYGSIAEHGMYFSNGGDNLLITNNRVHDNAASGIQINADPDYIIQGFGKRADGISDYVLLEKNIIYNNGELGGAAINLASVRNSKFRKNLLYNNLAGGIAGWDNEYGNDYGTINNRFVNNTIYFKPDEGRWTMSFKNGSINNRVVNNLLFGGHSGAFEFDDDSITGLLMNYNNLYSDSGNDLVTNEDSEETWNLNSWQDLGYDEHSLHYAPEDILLDLSHYDFHLAEDSPARQAGKDGYNIGRYKGKLIK
ncbi:MAG: right-handed parallel beta-helix repeat-containing protein [Patescibacteria group bacterium]